MKDERIALNCRKAWIRDQFEHGNKLLAQRSPSAWSRMSCGGDVWFARDIRGGTFQLLAKQREQTGPRGTCAPHTNDRDMQTELSLPNRRRDRTRL